MSTSNIIALIGVVLGGGGGGAAIARLTRLIVVLENLARSHEKVLEAVADHENRLNRGGL